MRKVICSFLCAILFVGMLTGVAYADDGQGTTTVTITIPEKEYSIIEGMHGEYDASSPAALRFRSDGAFHKFLQLMVDGSVLAKKHYSVWEGSTYAELSADYLASLQNGKHTLTFVFTDGKCSTDFTVINHRNVSGGNFPQTGDTASLGLWTAMLLTSGVAAVIIGFLWRKKRFCEEEDRE